MASSRTPHQPDYPTKSAETDRIRSRVKHLERWPAMITPSDRGEVEALLRDPRVNPAEVSAAGWSIVRQAVTALNKAPGAPVSATDLCATLEADSLAIALLEEDLVVDPQVEIALTLARRSLLLDRLWPRFPRLTEALGRQVALNGGAWWIGGDEAERLGDVADTPMVAAYGPWDGGTQRDTRPGDSVLDRVAAQYKEWPYPFWHRLTQVRGSSLEETARTIDPDEPAPFPSRPDILVAGCGTGAELAQVAMRYPTADVLAIDLSDTSLDHAARRCAALGLGNIRFRRWDLCAAKDLGQSFDAVFSAGVLHHLADPEAGWAALAGVLRPGGLMRVMVYSKTARLVLGPCKALVNDLLARPMTAGRLREARRRFFAKPEGSVLRLPLGWRDFYYLAGVHDLFFNEHEDPFDVSRVERVIRSTGLRLLRFASHNPSFHDGYRAAFSGDPLFRDFASLRAYERRHPGEFGRMYVFWMRKG